MSAPFLFVGKMHVVFSLLCPGPGLCRLRDAKFLDRLLSQAFRCQKHWLYLLQRMASGLLVWRVLFQKIVLVIFVYLRRWGDGVIDSLHSLQLGQMLFVKRIVVRQEENVFVLPGVCKLTSRTRLTFLVVNCHLFVQWFGC